MTRWFFPSWNGDVRIASHPEDESKTLITIIEPTADEKRVLKSLATIFDKKGWMGERKTVWNPRGNKERQESVIHAPIHDIGLHMIGALKPGIATLTAVKLEGGKVEAKGTGEKGFLAWVASLFSGGGEKEAVGSVGDLASILEGTRPDSGFRNDKETALAKKEEEKAAATVKRPTPSCPRCIPGAIEPASEVLLSFLTDEQHEEWAKNRCLIAIGGLTGHRYLIGHRHSKQAQRAGKICYDLDDGGVLHFHDNSVPPEEEVLAAKLILEHREPWLRNEATCFFYCSGAQFDYVFKNPFGGYLDGVPDSQFTGELGSFLRGLTLGMGKEDPNEALASAATDKGVYEMSTAMLNQNLL
jgi:hypothetical protein